MTSQEIAEPNTILKGLVGSTIHGTAVNDGHEDQDFMGVCLEPPECVIGFRRFEQWTWRSKPQGERSMAGDTDLVIYSLRKFAQLALGGNPSVLLLLFVPPEKCEIRLGRGAQLQELAPAFAARSAGRAYLGYMTQQHRRLEHDLGQKPNRPELVEKYGFDTKYAMQILRLGFQGIEFLTTGRLQLPMEERIRTHLRGVRLGARTLVEVLEEASVLEAGIKALCELGPLPAEPDRERVERFVIDSYVEWWKAKSLFSVEARGR
jgi:predicted nucleotidyltransferase